MVEQSTNEWQRLQVTVKAIFTSSGLAIHSICITRCLILGRRPSSTSRRFPTAVDTAHGTPMSQSIRKTVFTSLGQTKAASMKSCIHYSTLVWMIRTAPQPMMALFRLFKTQKSPNGNRIAIGRPSQSTVRTMCTLFGKIPMTDSTSISNSHRFTTNS